MTTYYNNNLQPPQDSGITTPFNLGDTTIKAYDCLYDSNNSIGSNCWSAMERRRNVDATIWSVYKKYEKVNAAPETSAAISRAKRMASADLKSAYDKIMGTITRANTPATGTATPYDGDINKLSEELNRERAEYDDKLASIMKLKDSGYDEYKSHYESTLMSGILWGTLAGTIIYYVFYK